MTGLELWAAGTGALGSAVLAAGLFHPRVPLFGPVVWHGDRSRQAVALSFDDGPHPEYTPQVASALRDAGARATFFCVGRHVETYPAVAAALVADGHEVANHTYLHDTASHLFIAGRLLADLRRAQQAFAQAGLPPSQLYRPAVGIRNPLVHQAASALGLTVITWADSARDGRLALTEQRAKALAGRAAAGDIICLHDGLLGQPPALREATVRWLPVLLAELRARGLSSVTVSQLLEPLPVALRTAG